MSSRILVIVLFALAAVIPTNVAKPHIGIGKTAEPHSHPWLLNLKWTYLFFMRSCGASLIRVPYSNDSSDIAITAAHCVGNRETRACDENKLESVELVASNHDQEEQDKGEISVSVAKSICHPDWKPPNSKKTDIAVLKLSKPLMFSETIQPIDLPRQGEEVPKAVNCIVAGWGDTTYGHDKTSGKTETGDPARYLQEVPIENLTNCSDDDTQLCYTVVHNRTVLSGDSGSSLVCKRGDGKVLYGVVSRVEHYRHKPIDTNVFAKVSAFTNWIEEQVGKLKRMDRGQGLSRR